MKDKILVMYHINQILITTLFALQRKIILVNPHISNG